MSDQYVKVTHKGLLSNIFGSFVGALLGIVMFFGSFALLWVNEGRVNMATVANKSMPVAAASVNASADGKLVALDGTLNTSETLGDDLFRPAAYVQLDRNVQMYAWTEHSSSETSKELGGGSTTKTTYTYDHEWTSSPDDSDHFQVSSGHHNPEMPVQDQTYTVSSATVGAYSVNTNAIEMPGGARITLTRENLALNKQQSIQDNYVFVGKGTIDSPQVGDIRIYYTGVPNNIHVTALGKAQNNQLVPYIHSSGDELYRVFDTDREGAIKQLGTEYLTLLWILRVGGFLLMWIGMILVLNPISAFANIIPMIGTLSGWVISFVTFIIAALLTILTVIIAIIAHSVWLMLGLLILLVVGGIAWSRFTHRATPAPAT